MQLETACVLVAALAEGALEGIFINDICTEGEWRRLGPNEVIVREVAWILHCTATQGGQWGKVMQVSFMGGPLNGFPSVPSRATILSLHLFKARFFPERLVTVCTVRMKHTE